MVEGLCATHPDPDMWFSEENETIDGVRPTEEDKEISIARSMIAIAICKQCPVKERCLEEGMKSENLDWGIWGGKMPGERLQLAGVSTKGHFRYNKVLFSNKLNMRERIREEYGV